MPKIVKKINHDTAKDIADIIPKPESKGGDKYTPRYIQLVFEGKRNNPQVLVIANQFLERKEELKKELSI